MSKHEGNNCINGVHLEPSSFLFDEEKSPHYIGNWYNKFIIMRQKMHTLLNVPNKSIIEFTLTAVHAFIYES